MKLQNFVVLALVAACGTDPSADSVGDPTDVADAEGDAGTDATIDTSPDAGSDTAVDSGTDTRSDTAVDADLDAEADADTLPDVETDAPADTSVDVGEGSVSARGWYSTSFEHAGFIGEGEVNPVSFGPGCNPYFVPLDGFEQWWTMAPNTTGLAMHPSPHASGWTRAGLIDAAGTLSESDPTGHMGEYDRDFTVESSTLHACETEERMPHCMTPRTGDLCLQGLEIFGETRRHELVEVLASPIGSNERFELRVITGEDVVDGRTDIVFEFNVARPDFEPGDARFVYGPGDLEVSHSIIELQGFAYVEVPFTVSTDAGWLVVDRSDGSIEVSLDLVREDGLSTRVWADFSITDTLALP